ncbi:MAG TPA: gamma-glutamyltransferase [Segeticoccus sp.]|nr:gamma-glutamyltransferase [Segeticoccus sp.]
MASTGRPAPRPLTQHKVDALGRRAAVAASHPAITLEGARVLAGGGNAVDATLAMASVGWMVLPGQCGIGGDVFALVREPDGRVWTVNGSGFGPDGGTPEFFREQGLSTLPLQGALSVTVPGAPAALARLGRHATRPLADLWRTGIGLARDGFACTAKTRADIAEHQRSLAADEGARAVFLPHGRLPEVGEPLVQADLADFLERLAGDPLSFYDGAFASRALTHLTAHGAPFSGREWELGRDVDEEPAISQAYGSGVLHQTPLPTPGWMMLQQAAICDGRLADEPLLGPEAVHWLAEAARAAFTDRYAECAADNDGWRRCLGPDRIRAARDRIAEGRRDHLPLQGVRVAGDTTSTVCVDEEGRAVSFIHSLAFTFGARLSVPGTGVMLNNRLGRGAYLVEGHPNEVQPRRKPLHTLNAWVLDDGQDGLRAVGNCPGGDGQVQWNMQVLSHLADHALSPQEAVSLPRFTVFPGSDANVVGQPEELRCEPGLDPDTLATLQRWGHRVVEVPAQVGGPGGSAMAVDVDHPHGSLRAGADPRMEGVALAL